MADSFLQFVEKTTKMVGELGRLENTTVKIAALAVKTSVLGELQVAGVKDGKLRGVGKKGAKVGVTFVVTGNTALVRATGPFPLIESDTKAHRIPKVRGSRARRRVIVIPGVGVRSFANHPGTHGKHPWEKGVVAAVPIAAKAEQVALGVALRKAYG
jgi:hypothetical protein